RATCLSNDNRSQTQTEPVLSRRYGRCTSRDRLLEIKTFSIKLGKLTTKGISGIATVHRFMGDPAHFFAKLRRLAQIRNRFKYRHAILQFAQDCASPLRRSFGNSAHSKRDNR